MPLQEKLGSCSRASVPKGIQAYLTLQEKGLVTWSSQGSQDLVNYICPRATIVSGLWTALSRIWPLWPDWLDRSTSGPYGTSEGNTHINL